MLSPRNVLLITNSNESNNYYKEQLQKDETVTYTILSEHYNISILSSFQSPQIDGILLELAFPYHDSIKFLRHLKEQMGDRCPPIVVIDRGDTKTAVEAFKNGAADYLVRDQTTPEDLRLAMGNAIENAQLRRELQRTQEQFQTSVENMLDCFGIFSAMRDESGQIVDFRIDYLNKAACENNQMPKEMQIGRGLCEVLPAHRESGLFDEYCQVVATGKPLIKDSQIYDDTFGDRRLVRVFDIRASKLNDGFVASWRDITPRKRLELELTQTVKDLQHQQYRLQRLIDTAPIGIGIGSANGEVKVMNDTMLHLHGLTREELEQQDIDWREFTPPEFSQQTEQAMEQMRQQGFTFPVEKELIRRDKTRIPIWVSGIQWMDGTDDHVAFAIDLTPQKQAEAAIQKLNQELSDRVSELQTLLEILPVGIAIATDATCTQMQSNAYIRQLLGISLGTNISKSAPVHEQPPYRVFQNGEEVPPENLPMQMAARLGVEVRNTELDILLPEGTQRQLLSYATPLKDDQNQIRGVIGAFLDITERNRDAAALKASQQRYQELAQAMPQIVWTADATGTVNYWNQRWYEYTGVSEAQSMGLEGVSVVHPNDRDRTLSQWSQAIAKGESFEIEYRIRRRDGEYHWFICRAIQTRTEQGQIKGWIGTITDIDNQKQVETALQQNQHRLDLAMKAAKMGTWDWDIQTGKIKWSPHLEHLVGMSPGSFDGRYETFRAMIHPEDLPRVEQAIHRAVDEGEEYNIEFRFIKPDGTVRWTLSIGRVFYDESGKPVMMTGIDMDISERKQAELALQEAHIQLEAALAAGGIYTWRWNVPKNSLMTDRNLAHLFNVDPLSAAAGLPIEQFFNAIHLEDRPQVTAAIEQAIATGEVYTAEYRIRDAEGKERWVIARGQVEYDANGNPIAFPGALADISDRKQVERELRQSEERFRTLSNNISQLAWMADEKGSIFWYNQRWFDYTGTTLEQMKGWGWEKVHHPDHLERVVKRISHCFETGEIWEDTFPLRGKDGQYRWFLSRAVPVRDEQGQVLRWFGTNTDITDRQQAQEALRQSEDRLRIAIESAQLGTWDWNLITNQLTWDVGCKAMFGLPPDAQSTIEVFFEALHPDDRHRLEQVIQQSLDPASNGNYDTEYRTIGIEDGVERWIKAKGQAYFDTTGKPLRFIGTVLDITKQKQIEAQREQLLKQEQAAREAAERANRIKDEFLAVLSHELRSPLNPILGWTKLLQTYKLDENLLSQGLATIERNVRLQTQLINDLLDIAKILRGKLTLNTTSVELSYVIKAALETVTTAAATKSITVHSVLPNIGQVSGDLARLQQIIWNLLSNAIKFTPKGGRVEISLERVGDQAQITVRDTGKGISPDFLPYIFETFRQEDTSITRKYGGLGLGLAIVRQLVEAHGGTITAESSGEGFGATFRVRLPLLNVELEIQPTDQLLPLKPDLTGIRVLAVDDDPDTRKLLTVLLSQYGADVLTVASGKEVLANLESFQPDVLVSDIGMPNLDGYTLIQQIRALPATQGGQIPAIALTAYAREDDRHRAISSGYQQHVPKPLDPDQLVQAVIELTL